MTLAYVDALQSIGAGEAALRTYASLGVKQIQLDSLGHLITPWAALQWLFGPKSLCIVATCSMCTTGVDETSRENSPIEL